MSLACSCSDRRQGSASAFLENFQSMMAPLRLKPSQRMRSGEDSLSRRMHLMDRIAAITVDSTAACRTSASTRRPRQATSIVTTTRRCAVKTQSSARVCPSISQQTPQQMLVTQYRPAAQSKKSALTSTTKQSGQCTPRCTLISTDHENSAQTSHQVRRITINISLNRIYSSLFFIFH